MLSISVQSFEVRGSASQGRIQSYARYFDSYRLVDQLLLLSEQCMNLLNSVIFFRLK